MTSGYNWRANDPRTEQLEKFGKVSEWPRASRSSSHVGGTSGHNNNSLVVLGLACWWLSLVWLGAGASGGCAPGVGALRWLVGLGSLLCFPFRGRRPEDQFSSVGIPLLFWDFGSLHQKHRESAGPWL